MFYCAQGVRDAPYWTSQINIPVCLDLKYIGKGQVALLTAVQPSDEGRLLLEQTLWSFIFKFDLCYFQQKRTMLLAKRKENSRKLLVFLHYQAQASFSYKNYVGSWTAAATALRAMWALLLCPTSWRLFANRHCYL